MLTTMQSGVIDTAMESVEFTEVTNGFHVEPRCRVCRNDQVREELGAMTDQELFAYEREHDGGPYMTLVKAKGMQRVALHSWHVGAARKKADREARAEAGRGLHQK
jgi:hypothetical protein